MSKTQNDDVEQHQLLPENNDDEIRTPSVRKPIKPYVGSASCFLLEAVFAVLLFIAFDPSQTSGLQFEIYSPVHHLLEHRFASLLNDLFDRTSFIADDNGFSDEITDMR